MAGMGTGRRVVGREGVGMVEQAEPTLAHGNV